MMIGRNRFNIYFVIAGVLAFAVGCGSMGGHKKDKDTKGPLATFRVHLEASPYFPTETEAAEIVRSDPVTLTVQKEPIVTEADLESARLLTVLGGYDLEVKLRQHGTWVLEQYTTENVGKHLAVFCQFGDQIKEHRWLGAIKITKRISDGTLTFTPDASKPELDEILTGWTNTIKKVNKAIE